MLTLVIGGSASGKSAFAERLAVQSGLPRFYVATMRVWDTESERRVARHRDMRREKRFDTLECPIGLDRLILPARGTARGGTRGRRQCAAWSACTGNARI